MPDFAGVPDGHKYAALVLLVNKPTPSSSLDGRVTGNVRAFLEAPIDLTGRWQEWLGSLRAKELKRANLFLIMTSPSENPDVLDHENLALTNDLERLYFALLMTLPYIGHPQATMLTGVRKGDTLDVRRVETIVGVYCAPGCHGEQLDLACLTRAMNVSAGIKTLQGTGEHSRVWRLVNAFYAGLKAPQAGERVHEFVRCLEGFVFPKIGKTRKQVVHRAKLFIAPPQDDVIGHLFDIRSSVEHLHGPFAVVTGTDLGDKNVALAERAYQAEVVARHCLHTLFTREPLWPHFRDDEALPAFWSMGDSKQRQLWGSPLDWGAAVSRFDRHRAALAMSSS